VNREAGVTADQRQERAQELLARVLERNAFQRARLERLGIDPDGVALGDLPPLTKQELVEDQRAHPPFGTNLTEPLEGYVRMHQTSGTTGPPLRLLHTVEDWQWWQDGLARTYRAAGVGAADRVGLAFSFGPHVQFWAADAGLRESGAMAIALGGMSSRQRLHTLRELAATTLVCTPTYALRLVEVALEHELEEAFATIERVICTGEPGASLPAARTRIEEAFGARCLDHAGLSEVGPYGYPCAEGGGFHVDEDAYLCEVLDELQQPAAAGARGELVLTPLGHSGFPVLRYRTGDVVVNGTERCPAGHPHRWLPGGIVGRTDAMVVIRGMNVYPSLIEEAVRGVAGAGEYRVTFSTEPGGMHEVKLEVELGDGASARGLQERIRQQVGLRVRIVPVALGALPRGDGKARRVVDLRRSGWPA
jgi:phenylacetate-CoA ligase